MGFEENMQRNGNIHQCNTLFSTRLPIEKEKIALWFVFLVNFLSSQKYVCIEGQVETSKKSKEKKTISAQEATVWLRFPQQVANDSPLL